MCPGFKDAQPQGLTPGAVNVNYGLNQASLTITWTISKAVRNKISDNGISHYNICFGGVNLSDPFASNPTAGFPTKTSALCPTTGIKAAKACPVADPIFQVSFFWGVIPDCTSPLTGPCMVSRTTGTGGTAILTFKVPAPWDPLPHGGS